MARHMRMEVLASIKEIGLAPIFYHKDIEVAQAVAQACVAGGARVVEFTNRGDRALDVFRELAKYRDLDNPAMILGAGSILNPATAALYLSAGADFIVSPVFCEDTARLCNAQKAPYLPGCQTVTEIHNAHQAGVEICKLFPGNIAGGPAFIKAIRGPMPWTEILPTGGVSPDRENLQGWFDAGAVCVGMGSKLIGKDILQQQNYQKLLSLVRETLALITEIRSAAK